MPTDPETRQEGAHFLLEEAAARIVAAAELKPGETVLDAGAGVGALTEPLSKAVMPGGRVVAVESHPDRVDVLKRRGWDGVKVVQGDILHVRLPDKVDAVVANPPYRILPAILRRLLDHDVGRLILVMPNELAERLTAPVGSDAYGRLTVETALRAKTRVLFPLSRRSFEPRPFVDSCVVRLEPKKFVEPERMGLLLDTAWESKRKTLRHSLSPLAETLNIPPQAVTDALDWIGGGSRTAMAIAPYEWGVLAQALSTAAPRRR